MVLFPGSHGESVSLLHLFHFSIDHAITYPDPQAVAFMHLRHGTDIFPSAASTYEKPLFNFSNGETAFIRSI